MIPSSCDPKALADFVALGRGESMDRQEVIALLADVAEALDNYSDVDDGKDGQPVPNWAMSLTRRIEEMMGRLERGK